jgi:hypothetical protein
MENRECNTQDGARMALTSTAKPGAAGGERAAARGERPPQAAMS